ncbi:MAG: very short patch repair endonuclease [Pseudomonadota bacterium]
MTGAARSDVLSPAARSAAMRAVKSKNTAPELKLRKALHALGLRYRLHGKDLPGSPDLVFPKHRTVVFVHGCFWHGHDCARGAREPKTNADYWRAKIARNRARDAAAQTALQRAGWRVVVVWACALKNLDATAPAVRAAIIGACARTDFRGP